MSLNIRYIGEKSDPGMGIIETGLFSGFEANIDEGFTYEIGGENVAKVESDAKSVTFYLNDVSICCVKTQYVHFR